MSSSTPEYLELQDVNPALSDYVFMHKADSQGLNRALQVLTYGYAYHLYVNSADINYSRVEFLPEELYKKGIHLQLPLVPLLQRIM